MANNLIETMDAESDNLALHVQLCEQRYIQLIGKFDDVDKKFDKIEIILNEIKSNLSNEESEKLKRYLTWAGVLITALIGGVVHLLTK